MKSKQPSLGLLVDRFMRAMHRYDAGRTLPLLHATKLTTPQTAALEFLREAKTVSTVAAHLGLSRPATSQLIDKLVRDDFVRRTEGTTDRRERNLILTGKGNSLVHRIAAARAARFGSSLAVLPQPVARRFHSILGEVIGALSNASRPAAQGPSRKRRIR